MQYITSIRSRLSFTTHRTLSNLTHVIQKWVAKSGEEWTVSRLKEIKVFFQFLLAHPDIDPTCVPLPFFKKDKEGLPRGAFSFLSQLYKNGDTRHLLIGLQMYTAFIKGGTATATQLNKFYSSVEAKPCYDPQYFEWLVGLEHDIKQITLPTTVSCKTKFEQVQWSPEKRSLDPRSLKTVAEGDLGQLYWLKSELAFKLTGYGKKHSSEASRLAGRLLQSTTDIPVDYFMQDDKVNFVGRVSYLQEPGFKLRAIANPGRPFQVALQQLGDVFFNHLRTIENDYTYDQDAGIALVKTMLKNKVFTHSIDLQDATNTFPFDYTKRMIFKLNTLQATIKTKYGYREEISMRPNGHFYLWEKLCRARWITPEGKLTRWKTGQPLGLYPSFPAFALSHHILVRSLWMWLGKPRVVEGMEFPYIILGDDIVIFDSQLASLYKDAIKKLGCKVSLSKTFASSHYAEFAGSHITKDLCINPGKWREVSDDNFLDYLRNVGPEGLSHLRPIQREIAEIVKNLPEPFGLGWNPRGLSLGERMSDFTDYYWSKTEIHLRGNQLDLRKLLVASYSLDGFFTSHLVPNSLLDRKSKLTLLYSSTNEYIGLNYRERYRETFVLFQSLEAQSALTDTTVSESLQWYMDHYDCFNNGPGYDRAHSSFKFLEAVSRFNFSVKVRKNTLLGRLRRILGV